MKPKEGTFMQRTLFLFTLEDVIISTNGRLNSYAEPFRR